MKEILKYHRVNLLRFKMATLNLPYEFVAIFLLMGMWSFVLVAMSSESPILYEGISIMNFNKLALFYFIASLLIDAMFYSFYDPNYKYFKFLYPYKLCKVLWIDFLIEFFSYKLALLIFFLLMYIPFCNNYGLAIFEKKSFIIGFMLILLMYANSCFLIQIVKDSLKSNKLNIKKNYMKLFLIILFIILTINENTDFLKLNSYSTIYYFLIIAILLMMSFISTLFLINLKNDKL